MHVVVAEQDLLHWKHTDGAKPLYAVTDSPGAFLPPHTIVAFQDHQERPVRPPMGEPVHFDHFVMEQAVCTRGAVNGQSKPLVIRQVFILTVPDDSATTG